VKPVEEIQKGGSKTEETTTDEVAHARAERLCFARVNRLFRSLTKKPKDVGLDQPNKFQFFEFVCHLHLRTRATLVSALVRPSGEVILGGLLLQRFDVFELEEHPREPAAQLVHDRADTVQLYADLCRRVASVGSQLLEHHLTDARSVWDNTGQLIAQLQAIRHAFLLRQLGPDSSSVRVAEHATNNDEHAHSPFSDHPTNDSMHPTNRVHLDFETAADVDATTNTKVTPTSRELTHYSMSPMRVRKRRPHFRPVPRPQTITVSLGLSACWRISCACSYLP